MPEVPRWMMNSKEHRQQNDEVYTAFIDAMKKEGVNEDEVVRDLAEKYTERWPHTRPWTPKRIRNLAAQRMGVASLRSRSVAEAKLLTAVAQMANDAAIACQNCDDEIQDLDAQVEDWVEIEQTTTTGGKYGGTESTKKLALAEQRRKIEDRKLDIQRNFLSTVAALTGKNVININLGTSERNASLTDLDAEIAAYEEKLKIKEEQRGD